MKKEDRSSNWQKKFILGKGGDLGRGGPRESFFPLDREGVKKSGFWFWEEGGMEKGSMRDWRKKNGKDQEKA